MAPNSSTRVAFSLATITIDAASFGVESSGLNAQSAVRALFLAGYAYISI
jgi:hypothetical protein